MAFTLTRRSVADPATLWAVVTDVGAHGRWIPLTRMVTDPGPTRLGWGFAGVTGLGPVGFSDAMVITLWAPPDGETGSGRMRLVKVGRVLLGWADVTVGPGPDGGSVVAWTEELGPRPRGLSRLLAPASRRLGAVLFGRALDGMVAEADARAGREAAGG